MPAPQPRSLRGATSCTRSTLRLWQYGRLEVNGLFALHGIAWDLDANGRLQRVLPGAAEPQVTAMFAELSRPEFHAARDLANAAQRHSN